MYRGHAFIQSKTVLENGGIFVVRSRSLVLAGGSKVILFVLFYFVVILIFKGKNVYNVYS